MNLVIDSGNSSAKVGIFEDHTLVKKQVLPAEELPAFIRNFSGENCIISSVSTPPLEIKTWSAHIKNTFILDAALPLPVVNHYATPATLGVDRLAAVCGAHHLFPGMNCLVIDAGTCITYDFLDDKGHYHGGAISPGLKMRFQAMHKFTARLPYVEPVNHPPLVGQSTVQCMQSGVVNGIIHEMEGTISRYQAEFGGVKIILCGGDCGFFENQLKASIFASPELVLKGLNSILIYNVNT
jgi:type III pantothenate kinase